MSSISIPLEKFKELYPHIQIHSDSNADYVTFRDAKAITDLGLQPPELISTGSLVHNMQSTTGEPVILQVEKEGRQENFVLQSPVQQVFMEPHSPTFVVHPQQQQQQQLQLPTQPQQVTFVPRSISQNQQQFSLTQTKNHQMVSQGQGQHGARLVSRQQQLVPQLVRRSLPQQGISTSMSQTPQPPSGMPMHTQAQATSVQAEVTNAQQGASVSHQVVRGPQPQSAGVQTQVTIAQVQYGQQNASVLQQVVRGQQQSQPAGLQTQVTSAQVQYGQQGATVPQQVIRGPQQYQTPSVQTQVTNAQIQYGQQSAIAQHQVVRGPQQSQAAIAQVQYGQQGANLQQQVVRGPQQSQAVSVQTQVTSAQGQFGQQGVSVQHQVAQIQMQYDQQRVRGQQQGIQTQVEPQQRVVMDQSQDVGAGTSSGSSSASNASQPMFDASPITQQKVEMKMEPTFSQIVHRDPVTGAEKVVYRVPTDDNLSQPPRLIFISTADKQSPRLSSPQAMQQLVSHEVKAPRSRGQQPGVVRSPRPAQYRPQAKKTQQAQPRLPWGPQLRGGRPALRNAAPVRVAMPANRLKDARPKNARTSTPSSSPRSRSSSSDEISADAREQVQLIASAMAPSKERDSLSQFLKFTNKASTPPVDQQQLVTPSPSTSKSTSKPRKNAPRKQRSEIGRNYEQFEQAFLNNETVFLLPPGSSPTEEVSMSVTQLLQRAGILESGENAYAEFQSVSPLLDGSEESPVARPAILKSTQQILRPQIRGQGVRGSSPRGPRPVTLPVMNAPGTRPQQNYRMPATSKEQVPNQQGSPNVPMQTPPGSNVKPPIALQRMTVNANQVKQSIQKRLPNVSKNVCDASTSPQQPQPLAKCPQQMNSSQTTTSESLPSDGDSQEPVAPVQKSLPPPNAATNIVTPGGQLKQQQTQPHLKSCLETSKGVEDSSSKVQPPVKDEEPPRYLPGLLALCPFCGIPSPDFNRCYRCKRKLHDGVRIIKDEKSEPAAKPAPAVYHDPPVPQQHADKKEESQEKLEPDVEKKKPKPLPKKKKTEEPVILLISSDEEGGAEPPEENTDKLPTIDKEPVYTPKDMAFSSDTDFNEVLAPSEVPEDGQYTSMISKWCRVGNYKTEIRSRVIISSKSISFKLLSPEDESLVDLDIKWKHMKCLLVSYSKSEPLLFIWPLMSAAVPVRFKLGMNVSDCAYNYSPTHEVQAYKRLIIALEKMTDENKVVLNNIINRSMLQELNDDEVDRIMLLVNSKVPPVQAKLQPHQAILNYENYVITIGDYSCLTEEQYLNDVIIDFYLTYLSKKIISPQDRARTHIFSSFFYNCLTKKAKRDCSKDSPAEKRHKRVRRWTKKTNLFDKDFIIIPINEHSHWFLAIICYPNLGMPVRYEDNAPIEEFSKTRKCETAKPLALQIGNTTITQLKVENGASKSITLNDDLSDRDEAEANEDEIDEDDEESEAETASSQSTIPLLGTVDPDPSLGASKRCRSQVPIKQPCILIFDSLRGSGSRARVVATLRDFLKIEYKWKTGEDRDFNKDNCKGAVLKVPQQNNYTDCGLYVLQYVESFFQSPLRDYRLPIRYLQDWFSDDLMRNKRSDVASVIQNLMLEQGKDPRSVNLPEIRPSVSGMMDEDEEEEYEEMCEEEEEEDMEMGVDINECMEADFEDMARRFTEEHDDDDDDDDDIDDEPEEGEIGDYNDEDDDDFDKLEPGEIRIQGNTNHAKEKEAIMQNWQNVQNIIEQSKARPVSEQARKSLKNIRIQRPTRKCEPQPKKMKNDD